MQYVYKTIPYAHQKTALQKSRLPDRRFRPAYAYFMEMGCVDCDTEYLSPTGWRKMNDYDGGRVAQFTLDGKAEFVSPSAYVVKDCPEFVHYKTERGIDQMLSPDHRILHLGRKKMAAWTTLVGEVPEGFRNKERDYTGYWRETTPTKLGESVYVPTTFELVNNTTLDLTDDEIRVQVAFHADGSYGTKDLNGIGVKRKGGIRIKKSYKKERLRLLLGRSGIPYTEKTPYDDGFSVFSFIPPLVSKTYGDIWWSASLEQRRVVCEEVTRWDGTRKDNGGEIYRSKHKSDVDFIQYCFSSTGRRCVIHYGGDECWGCNVTGNGRTTNLAMMYGGKKVPSVDGKMYCFSVPSSYLIFRRNGRVFVSGNTGKTKVMIDEMCQMYLEGAITLAIIFAPKGVYLNWPERELPVHMPDDIAKEADVVSWNEGGKGYDFRLQKLFKKDGRFKVFFMNIEALSMSKKALEFVAKLMREHSGRILMGIDESTTIKNVDSIRAKEAVRLGRLATYRRILTGSPVTRSPLDLYSQFEFLGEGLLGFGSWFAFRARYAILKEIAVRFMRNGKLVEKKTKIVVNFRNVEELTEKIQPYSYRVLKEECLDLPPKIYIHREVEMTDDQERIYKEILSKASAALGQEEMCYQCEGTGVIKSDLDDMSGDFICAVCQGNKVVRGGDHVTVQMVITKILRLHQVLCGHVMDENGVVHDIKSNRVQALMDFLEESGGRGIIWCKYRRDIENVAAAIEKVYGPGAAVQYHGGVDRAGRETASFRFQGRMWKVNKDRSRTEVICPDDERATYMISNPQTGGYGNTWTEASWEAYFSNDYDLEKRLQSEDRAHRAGQTKSVTICDFYVPRTVEAKIIKALRDKIDISTAIMGDGYREWLV